MVTTKEDRRRLAGRMIVCGFDGTSVTAELKEVLREVQPAGLILFKRNVESPEQVFELIREVKSLPSEYPLMFSVDQEGGHVARIKEPATLWPAMASLGAINDTTLTYRVASALAREIRAIGFDVNFSPVVDVNTNPDNPVIGSRSFGAVADLVGTHGRAFYRGLHESGVGACAKHFPGHGDTDLDSHFDLPVIHHSLERLRRIDWPPFRELVVDGVGAIMSAHVLVEELDDALPGTLSQKTLSHLRNEIGFEGVIVSDDVEMKALSERFSVSDIALKGAKAGIDLFLACHKPVVQMELYRALIHGMEQKQLRDDDLLKSEKRLHAWLKRFVKPSGSREELNRWVGCPEHRVLAEEVEIRFSERAALA
uniref:Glycosy hydrolase family protein n=1 Tax=uncultured organism MedDCM-OCT-S01-C81 TaxID=743603 RepID=D6PJL2_9ZZZZ|nr:glycosy hydrolase family protein [uncultured organism MedDCM-OCT-S01-C81]